jgi:hypothetical protein
VQEQDLASLMRATGASGEGEAACLDLEPVNRPVCVHVGGVRRAYAAVPPLARTSSGLSRSVASGTASTSARCAT